MVPKYSVDIVPNLIVLCIVTKMSDVYILPMYSFVIRDNITEIKYIISSLSQ